MVRKAAAPDHLTAQLAAAGFLAAAEEAALLRDAAGGDGARLDAMVQRRLTGDPLAWITGSATFCDVTIIVEPGVYVPRWHTEPLARRAIERLPDHGTAIDLCTGSGAIAGVLAVHRPRARVVATDIDARAVACARRNGVEAVVGDLFGPLDESLRGAVDVVTAVVPYVPRGELALLQRDTFTFETPLAYDGGADGTDVLRRVVRESTAFLRPGGALLLELGGDQPALLRDTLRDSGFTDMRVLRDDDGDARGIEATRAA